MGKHPSAQTWLLITAAACLMIATAGMMAIGLSVWGGAAASNAPPDEAASGYTAAAAYGGGFLAVGSGGRIDRIGDDGAAETLSSPTEETLTCLWTDGEAVLTGGRDGTLLRSEDGVDFRVCESGTDADILGLARFNGTYFACAEDGVLLASPDGTLWETRRLDTGDDLIAIAAGNGLLLTLTADTELFTSTDGVTWTRENFNERYGDFYPAYVFSGAAALGDTVFVLGRQAEPPGAPLIMFTETGTVWMPREVAALNGAAPEENFPLTPLALGQCGDQLVFLCDGGRLLVLPDCVQCSRLLELDGQTPAALACGADKLLTAGADFHFEVLDGAYVRQDKIAAAQALADVNSGAVLIDVREAEERTADGYIPGSLHLPLGQVAEMLADLVPDKETELIFYCAKGSRAQQALETAQTLGYDHVYNLGGLSDWPYDISK